MSRRMLIWIAAALATLIWLVLSWSVGLWLGVAGGLLWGLRIGMVLLGGAAIGVLTWYFLKENEGLEPRPAAPDADALAVVLAELRARLAASKQPLGRLPVVVCLGPASAAKTTIIQRSGLDAELLAGDASRGDAAVATNTINAWIGGGTVFLELGGALLADEGKFRRVVAALQPNRLGAVLGRGAAAPRAALVCISVADLQAAGAGEPLAALARGLRDRLQLLSQRLGVRVPVYVLLTKADRIAHFEPFVRPLTSEEVRAPLGMTLPWDDGPIGTYPERLGNRLARGWDRMVTALGERRLDLLWRNAGQATDSISAYEFPREVQKIGGLVAEFLVELCRPSQLAASPVLRGVYLTGVRPTTADERAAAVAPAAAPAPVTGGGATQAFTPAQLAAAMQQLTPKPAATSHRIPQWTFLHGLFRDVLLADHVAAAATAGGSAVQVGRRVLVAAAAVLALVVSTGMLVSFVGNRGLTDEVARAMATPIDAPGTAVPAPEVLARLDSLRLLQQRLDTWRTEGAPVSLRWGLYAGNRMTDAVRARYFAAFDTVLLEPVVQRMAGTMAALPDAPTPAISYASTYATLKAYLLITTESPRATPEFLAPTLGAIWSAEREVPPASRALADTQFAAFARALVVASPLPRTPDSALVLRSRALLNQYKGTEQIYQVMVGEASQARGVSAFDFARKHPNPAVGAAYVVPGAYTRAGWAYMQGTAFRNVDRYLRGEEWVLGAQAVADAEQKAIVDQLRAQYRADYVAQWQKFLGSLRHLQPANVADASKKMLAVGGNPSPLLQGLNAVAVNTAVDSGIAAVFQPVTQVSPADSMKLIAEPAQPYMQALISLGTALQTLATAPPAQNEAPAAEAKTQISSARNAAISLTLGFTGGKGTEGVSADVRRLLVDPLTRIDPLVGSVGVAGVNGGGASLCGKEAKVLTKAPFTPGAAPAAITEVNEFFQRPASALWNLYNGQLARFIVPQGDGYAAAPGGTVKINPRFLAFFSRAAQVSKALYPEGQTGPRLQFGFRPTLGAEVTALTLTVDGQAKQFTRSRAAEQLVTWVGADARQVKLDITAQGVTDSQQKTGTWALWEIFARARNWRVVGGVSLAEFPVRTAAGETLVPFEVRLSGAPSLFDPTWLRFSCVPTIALP